MFLIIIINIIVFVIIIDFIVLLFEWGASKYDLPWNEHFKIRNLSIIGVDKFKLAIQNRKKKVRPSEIFENWP